jgi:hypothetical protein
MRTTYTVTLYRTATPEEFKMNDSEAYGFLATRLGSEDAASAALAEADHNGTAERTIEYSLAERARVVISSDQISAL